MPGVPPDLDLSFLHGAEVVQVCLGVYQVQIHFAPNCTLSIEGDWELIGDDGSIIDRQADQLRPRERPYYLHLLLQRVVVLAAALPPSSIELRFTHNLLLRVFAGGEYESFSIEPGNIFV